MQKVFTAELAGRQAVATRLLANGVAQKKLVHAILLTGRAHSDKWQIARQLAAYLNCERPDKEDAGACLLKWQDSCVSEDGSALETIPGEALNDLAAACQNCRWLLQDEHPKAWLVLSAEAGKSGKIPVEAARNLSEELARTSQYIRVVVVEEANDAAFHRPAANALLKTIEEPKSPVMFLLFSQTQDDVLTTIVSRCQVVPLNNLIENNIGQIGRLEIGPRQLKSERIQELVEKLREHIFVTRLKASAKDALHLAAYLQVLLDEDYESQEIIDTLITLELESLKAADAPLVGSRSSAYMGKLLKVSEDAKRQIDQYVSKKAVCESFVLTWHDLRQNFNRLK
jgi:DNA polymerase III delta prime subunit